jgi:hypothetical protein
MLTTTYRFLCLCRITLPSVATRILSSLIPSCQSDGLKAMKKIVDLLATGVKHCNRSPLGLARVLVESKFFSQCCFHFVNQSL